MCRICVDRVIPDKYQPARAETHNAAAQHFRASVAAMAKQRKLKPDALGNPSRRRSDRHGEDGAYQREKVDKWEDAAMSLP